MTLGELMQERGPIATDFTGIVTNDDMVLAIGPIDTHPDNYLVVQGAIAGIDAQLNATTQEKTYIRAGMSSTKTGNQRTFAITGDRYVGDEFQDMVFSHEGKYNVGEEVAVGYVYFCLLNGKGEYGIASIVVNSDGGGAAGEAAAIDVALKATGGKPESYIYEPETP